MSLWWADRTACIRKPAFDFPSLKESDFLEWLQSYTRYGDAAISNATINAKPEYGKSAHVVMAAGRNYAFKIAAK